MTPPLLAAAARLESVLQAENAALARLDIAGSAALLGEKLAASRDVSASLTGAAGPECAAAALRLRTLAAENTRLLERAIQVQGRVMEIVARAARQAAQQAASGPLRYGARGAAMHGTGAMALQTQA